jgi:4-amino-4-deoxy-L-arabinose transferase-like glycosyltransferase
MSRLQPITSLARMSPRQIALLLFCTALVARFLFSAGFQTWNFIDRWQYGQEIGRIGRFLVELGEFVVEPGKQTSKFPPVYPFIVALVFRIWGVYTTQSALVLFLIQSTCAGLAAICLMLLGSRIFNRTTGLVAGFAWALYPSSLFESTAVVWYSELSILLALLLILVATSPPTARLANRFALLGILSGILILTDSSMLVYAVLIPVWVLVSRRISWRSAAMPVTALSLAAVAVLSPWAIRNWKMFGSPSVLKSNFGMELFFGNNPYSSGGTLDSERRQALAALPADELARSQNGAESEYFALLQRHGVQWISGHPGSFLKLTAIRVWNYWGKFPSDGPDRWRHYSWFHILWYFPVLFLAAYGIRDRSEWRGPLSLIILFLVVYPLPYYLTHVQLYRYRYPIEPFLVLLAAVPVATWLETRRPAGLLQGS